MPDDIHTILKLSHTEVQALADRLFSRGISHLSTCSHREQRDMVAASRTIRELLRLLEKANGRELHSIFICGRV